MLDKIRLKFKKIPSEYRRWSAFGILLALLLALPITIWGLTSGRFEVRERAVTSEITPTPAPLPPCDRDYQMVWRDNQGNTVRKEPYILADDACVGFRCLANNNEINPACYAADQCGPACPGQCVNIPQWKKVCVPTPTPIPTWMPTPTPLPRPRCEPSSIKPPTGPPPLTVTLHGGGSAGYTPGINGYQWDFEGDGIWDTTEITIWPATHVYTQSGTYYPKYRVHSVNGQWSDICNYPFPIIVCVPEGQTMPVYPGYQCCPGLAAISTATPDANGNCPTHPLLGASICTKCGNGSCGPGENKCNCPEDCLPTPTVAPAPLRLKIKFEGVTSRPADDSDKEVKIYATNLTGGPNLGSANSRLTMPLKVDDSGVYSMEFSLDGPYFGHHYRLRVKGPKHLQSVFPDVYFQAGGELDLTASPLRPGDLDQNGKVDLGDLRSIKVFSKDPADIAFGDVNFDNRVDIFDKVLVLNTLSVQYDPD